MKILIFLILSLVGSVIWAQEDTDNQVADTAVKGDNAAEEPAAEGMRDPASDIPGKKSNEEELRVLTQLPEAQTKKDARSMQSEVYKQIYNRELKPDQREDVLDE